MPHKFTQSEYKPIKRIRAPKLRHELRMGLAADFARAATEQIISERGITMWAHTNPYAPLERYLTPEAQEIFDEFYYMAEQAIESTFGPDPDKLL